MKSKIRFRMQPHSERIGVKVVEILLDGRVCGVICPAENEPNGIKLISAHFAGPLTENNQIPEGIKMDTAEGKPLPIPCIEISFHPRKYFIAGGRLIPQ